MQLPLLSTPLEWGRDGNCDFEQTPSDYRCPNGGNEQELQLRGVFPTSAPSPLVGRVGEGG